MDDASYSNGIDHVDLQHYSPTDDKSSDSDESLSPADRGVTNVVAVDINKGQEVHSSRPNIIYVSEAVENRSINFFESSDKLNDSKNNDASISFGELPTNPNLSASNINQSANGM